MRQLTFKNIKQSGFTLLEILLVLAVVAVITVFVANGYQQQILNSRVDKTSIQMQQWLEAAKAFYVNCGAWPAQGVTNPQPTPTAYAQAQLEGVDASGNPVATCNQKTNAPKNVSYVQPATIDNSPWYINNIVSPYVFVIPTAPPGGGPNSGTNYFGVQITVPTQVIGQRIAGQLPNGVPPASSTAPFIVTASVAIPGSGGTTPPTQTGPIVVGVVPVTCTDNGNGQKPPGNAQVCTYNLANGQSFPTCPTGMTMQINATLVGLTTYASSGGVHPVLNTIFVDLSNVSATSAPKFWVNGPSCPGTCFYSGAGSLLATVSCYTPTSSQTTSAFIF